MKNTFMQDIFESVEEMALANTKFAQLLKEMQDRSKERDDKLLSVDCLKLLGLLSTYTDSVEHIVNEYKKVLK